MVDECLYCGKQSVCGYMSDVAGDRHTHRIRSCWRSHSHSYDPVLLVRSSFLWTSAHYLASPYSVDTQVDVVAASSVDPSDTLLDLDLGLDHHKPDCYPARSEIHLND